LFTGIAGSAEAYEADRGQAGVTSSADANSGAE
jgi:hypothetical protein